MIRRRQKQAEIFDLNKAMNRAAASVASNVEGSPAWALSQLVGLRSLWKSIELDEDLWRGTNEVVDRHEIWNLVPEHAPFGSKEAMLRAIGITPEKALAIGRDPALLAVRAQEAAPSNPNGTNRFSEGRVDNINPTKGGTSSDYRLARLKRDCPEIVERIVNGEFKSVNAAWRHAVESGAVTIKYRVSPVEKVLRQITKLSHTDLVALRDQLNGMLGGEADA